MIIHGNCMEHLRNMDENSFDLVLTDPPYGLPGENMDEVRGALMECRRVSKMQIVILDWRNPLSINDEKFAELVWEYGWISGGRTKTNHFYPTHNTIHFLGDNLFRFDTRDGSIIKRQPGFSSPRQCSYAKKSGHKFEKPLKLMEYLLERSDCYSVLDPFAGSGTTGVACKKLNIDFLLIEICKEYCEIARKRLEDLTRNGRKE